MLTHAPLNMIRATVALLLFLTTTTFGSYHQQPQHHSYLTYHHQTQQFHPGLGHYATNPRSIYQTTQFFGPILQRPAPIYHSYGSSFLDGNYSLRKSPRIKLFTPANYLDEVATKGQVDEYNKAIRDNALEDATRKPSSEELSYEYDFSGSFGDFGSFSGEDTSMYAPI